jgi:HPt (histidine-containing phosphotransfer) domain-containing protein
MAGFNEHLSKPVQASTLGTSIARALTLHRAASTEVSAATGHATLPQDSDAERLRATVRRLSDVKPDDRSFAPTVTESFALRSAQLIETLRTGIDTADAESASRAARALKSSAEFLGALRLASMSGDLDGACSEGRWDAASELLAAIDREHQAVLTLLFESSR